jgi:hypothetical protein
MRADVPAGWDGSVQPGVFAVASYPLPREGPLFARAPRRLRPGRVLILVTEYAPMAGERPACLPRSRAPRPRVLSLPRPGSWPARARGVWSRGFCLAGRHFTAFVLSGSRPPATTALARAGVVLASFRAARGDFYPGTVAPARFRWARGWHVGTGGRARVRPQGVATTSWAATVPYRDPPFHVPPHRTLRALPRDGIAILLGLVHDSRGVGYERWNTLRIDRRRIEAGFEGVPSRFGLYRAVVPRRAYALDLWVFFGSAHPSRGVVARAQAEFDAVRLPDWRR